MKKTKSRWESTNFITNILTLVVIVLGYQGIQLTVDPGEAVEQVMAMNWEYVGGILLPALAGLAFKVIQKIQEKTWDWGVILKSRNFWDQVITILAGVLMGVGILLPADAPAALTEAIFSGSVITIIVAIAANILNPLWHFLKPILFPPKTDPVSTARK